MSQEEKKLLIQQLIKHLEDTIAITDRMISHSKEISSLFEKEQVKK